MFSTFIYKTCLTSKFWFRCITTLSQKRGSYASLLDSDLLLFEETIGRAHVRTTDLDDYNVDFMKWYRGQSSCVLLPENAEQISVILRHCFERNIAVVPQSGNTGLVGASVPVFDEVIISLKRLNKNFELDKNSGILRCDSGFILEELDQRLAKHGFMLPLDLGSKGSCLIGGTVATNAGGIRLIRYGSMHSNVLGLEVVLPDKDGTILSFGSSLRKDNSNLHLNKLFIGSEGQLGIITRVSIVVVPRPASIQTTLLGVDSFNNCLEILTNAKKMLNETLSSFEMMDSEAIHSVEENLNIESPLSTKYPFNLIIEISGSNHEHDLSKIEAFLTFCLESGLAEDGLLTKTIGDAQKIWKVRESIPLAQIPDGHVFKHDFTLPLEYFYQLTGVVKERVKGLAKRVVTFGHLGDGNTHMNVTTPTFDEKVYNLLYPFIYEWVHKHGGSISAEHGIGQYKLPYYLQLTDKKKIELNSRIKKIFDPRGIISPYKMIRNE